jgi:hypothetical protein
MSPQKLQELGEEHELMVMDGYDDCIVGTMRGADEGHILVYDREKVIRKLMAEGMDRDEAEEFHEFNQAGAYVGPQTPIFLDNTSDD